MAKSIDADAQRQTLFHLLTWARNRKGATCVLLGLWAGSALQPVALALEFWALELEICGSEAWYYARFYSHMFVYPVTFGFFSTLFLISPFVETVDILRRRGKLFIFMVLPILLVVVVASVAEFSQSTGAIWEFSPGVLHGKPSGIKAREILENRCRATENTEESYSAYPDDLAMEDPYNVYLNELSFSELLKNLEEEARSHKWAELSSLEKIYECIRIRSWTNMAYKLGYASMTALFMLLFVTFFIAVTEYRVRQRTMERLMDRLTYALVFASFWVLMRITFMVEKFSIFTVKDDKLFIFNFLIFLLFLFVYSYLLTILKDKSYTPVDKFNHGFLSIFGITELFLGTAGLANWMSDILVRLFGTRSDLLTYTIIGVFLLVVFFPKTLRACDSPDRDQALKKPFKPPLNTR